MVLVGACLKPGSSSTVQWRVSYDNFTTLRMARSNFLALSCVFLFEIGDGMIDWKVFVK